MKCDLESNSATYGNDLFCRTCGMDIEFNAVRVDQGVNTHLYCCKDCANEIKGRI